MRVSTAGLLLAMCLGAAAPAQAMKIKRITTIIPLTDAMMQTYITCVPAVDKAVEEARRAFPETGYSGAVKRRRAGGLARQAALQACGVPHDFPWAIVYHSVTAARHNCCASTVYVSKTEETARGVARVQAANRRLIAKYGTLP